MKLDKGNHIFISDLPPLCCWGQEELSCPWKPSSSVVCDRETTLLTISTPVHSRAAILRAGLFRAEKLQFCYGNSMRCCGLLTRQTSKKQMNCGGQMKGHMHHMHIFHSSSYSETDYAWHKSIAPNQIAAAASSSFFPLRKSLRKL